MRRWAAPCLDAGGRGNRRMRWERMVCRMAFFLFFILQMAFLMWSRKRVRETDAERASAARRVHMARFNQRPKAISISSRSGLTPAPHGTLFPPLVLHLDCATTRRQSSYSVASWSSSVEAKAPPQKKAHTGCRGAQRGGARSAGYTSGKCNLATGELCPPSPSPSAHRSKHLPFPQHRAAVPVLIRLSLVVLFIGVVFFGRSGVPTLAFYKASVTLPSPR